MGVMWTKDTIWTCMTGRKGAQKNGFTWVQPCTAASLPSFDWTARVCKLTFGSRVQDYHGMPFVCARFAIRVNVKGQSRQGTGLIC